MSTHREERSTLATEQHLYYVGVAYAPSRRTQLLHVHAPTKREAHAAALAFVERETGYKDATTTDMAGGFTPHATVNA